MYSEPAGNVPESDGNHAGRHIGRYKIVGRRAAMIGTAAVLLIATPIVSGATMSANAAKTHYTHSTALRRACPIYENFPKQGIPVRTWPKRKGGVVGVRYTYKGYAMVLDHARKARPNWGFIAKTCLRDPRAYSHGDHGTPLPDLRAIGGNGAVKAVPISASHSGKSKRALIHVTSKGSLRSGDHSFVIGAVRIHDPFYITRAHCGHHSGKAWILGYAPNSGRWGYIEASHLAACH